MKFALFMSTPAGRVLRVIAGIVLLVIGIAVHSALGIVGAAVLLAGAFDVCVIAPLLRQPFTGKRIRAHAH